MDYGQACIELAKLIQCGHFEYIEDAGLAIQVLNELIDDDEDPKMALALAKNLDSLSKRAASMRNT